MTLLIAGLALWCAAHLLRRISPETRARLGGSGKAVIAGLLVLSVVLMVLGYRGAEFVPVYTPPAGSGHINNTLMLISVFLFGVGGTKGTLYPKIRHPMLWGAVIWSVAHLLVNGDRASLVLFGGIGLWALVSMALINRAGAWVRPNNGRGIKGDAMNLFGTLVLFGLIAMVHKWLGHPVFEGSYY
ncbi:NnrU family protein [Xinfangfangia sp. CPCC 101601]|uniref:NnrU family protein n=1 Tax=Pseudogemmobacter lacusdianii TaxID=3069608 RepID=A0ABU0VWN4_9RHOB|nr:NnrU family protein [Xinfangfangia sp. CPCC 101601]MDQ2066169.1 NnrU family protein [Xinfangfangia sp. CPCC 101601]